VGQPIRLDLGAGHARDTGWVRLDLALERQKVGAYGQVISEKQNIEPDIVCDIRDIPLPDDYADKARAIHVIEHFYPWEALKAVKEWVRVIKPGGELAIECPCLEKVVALAQVPECPPWFVHWGLYGDPRLEDPSMMHHWCYSKMHLAKLMGQAGLVNLRPEPPMFHQPIRDMRMVGVKPEREQVIQLA
jgi:SAM-dependent methyltransferase